MLNAIIRCRFRYVLCALGLAIGVANVVTYRAQAAEPSQVLIVVGPSNHPPGSHEVAAGGLLMKHCLEHSSNVPGIQVQVVKSWPTASEREKADTVVFIGDTFPAGRFPNAQQNLDDLRIMMQRGCGIVCVHYATGLLGEDVTKEGDHPLLEWMGGYFANRSCPHHESFAKIFESATITPAASHPICRGWKSFTIKDEPYTNNFFGKEGNRVAANVTQLATSMLPPENPKPECVAWCVERADKGRGFGIVMPHFYKNWKNDDLRRFIMNGIVWTARIDVPENGVETTVPELAMFSPESVEPLPPKPKKSANASNQTRKEELLIPVWQGNVVHGESTVLLQETDDGPLVGRLAFPVKKLLAVRSSNREKTFEQLDRVLIDPATGTITFPRESNLPFIATKDLYLPPQSPGSYRHRVGHPDQWLRFGPGKWFHDHQIEVTYEREAYEWKGELPKLADERLPKTLEKLRKGETITIGISGDSISTGLDSSATSKSEPGQPGYPELVIDRLKMTYKSELRLVNRAVGGWSVASGIADVDALMANSPDLVIVAYGMNDVGRRDPAWFRKRTNELIERIHAARADTEIILVATMLGNKEWMHTPRDMFALYRDELKSLRQPGIELADVGSIWEELLIRKHDLDLTGNGLNHPNDFGHRLYAQTISALLVK